MRDWMLLFGVLALVPAALGDVFVALLVWGWTAFVSIDGYTYGFMQAARLNLLFGVITLFLLVVQRDRLVGGWGGNRTVVLMLLFLAHATVSALLAYPGNEQNWVIYDKVFKTLLFALLMPLVIAGRLRIHAFVVMLCLGLGFHGLVDGLKFIASGGHHIVVGLLKFGDNNHFAVILSMTFPLLLYAASTAKSRLIRYAMLGTALLCIAAIVGTRSRGGFATLLVVAVWLILHGRQKMRNLLLMGGAGALVLALGTAEWSERMNTIKEAGQDNSFMQRVEAWQVSSEIALANPVFGGGFHAVQVQSVWSQFVGKKGLLPFVAFDWPSPYFRAAHSVYFELLGDLGFVGLLLFVLLILNAIFTGFSVRRRARAAGPEHRWLADLAITLIAVIIAFLIGGFAVSIAYTEMVYVVAMLLEILRREARALEPSAGPQAVSAALPIRRPSFGAKS